MIVLITGASHTGKTALAQRLLERFKYPYLSIDHLKMGLIRSGQTELTAYDDDKLTAYLWPIVREMIKTAMFAEMAIVYGNRYRVGNKEIDDGLEKASIAFMKGNFKLSLEKSINAINIIEPGI